MFLCADSMYDRCVRFKVLYMKRYKRAQLSLCYIAFLIPYFFACGHTHMHTCARPPPPHTHTHMHAHAHMRTRTHKCIHTHAHTHTHTHIHICTHTRAGTHARTPTHKRSLKPSPPFPSPSLSTHPDHPTNENGSRLRERECTYSFQCLWEG